MKLPSSPNTEKWDSQRHLSSDFYLPLTYSTSFIGWRLLLVKVPQTGSVIPLKILLRDLALEFGTVGAYRLVTLVKSEQSHF